MSILKSIFNIIDTTQKKVSISETWCDRDKHNLYEYFLDFNDWIDSEEGAALRFENNIEGLSNPSKAFYASDREAYDQAFNVFRDERRSEVLNENYLCDQFEDDHWYQRNLLRFDQLVDYFKKGTVVPFIGAGVSVAGGFPTWKDHLRQQGRTAGIDSHHVEELLEDGELETIIQEIESLRGRDVFVQEIRDVFSRTGELTDITLRIAELFTDTIITTNYDRLIEQSFDTGEENNVQVINSMNALERPATNKITIIKLHGDFKHPNKCILSKNQYDEAYGAREVDLSIPIPKILKYYYRNSCLLFLGCSLNKDRTIQVFQEVKNKIGDEDRPQHFSIEQAPESEEDIVERNAYLSNYGITPIWFEKGQFDFVESILRHARNELRYMGNRSFNNNKSIKKSNFFESLTLAIKKII